MAGGRRGTARSTRPPVPPSPAVNPVKPSSPGCDEIYPPQPVPLPDIPHDSQTTFEVLVFMYNLAGLGLQYLNLYRSVWWLPHSYNSTAVSFYLIDPSVIAFSVLLLGRRLLWLGLKAAFVHLLAVASTGRFLNFSKYCFSGLLLNLLFYISYFIMRSHSLVTILYLVYPFSLYIILFGVSLSPFLDLIPGTQGRIRIYKDKLGIYRTNLAAAGGLITSPELVRTEVAITKADFNARLKQVLFNALLNSYYAGCIPCLFAQSFLQMEFWWVLQHSIIIFLGSCTLYLVQLFPAGYHNLLHRGVLSLGIWTRMTGRLSPSFYSTWSPATMWPGGSIVRHGKDLYKAEGTVNAGEPGNNHHIRYYYMFSDPSILIHYSLLNPLVYVL
ncbi:transmembrane protein 39A isoform X2 [Eurytemora carolleeae]|uniref:transmembrane protein 39A isoform X2 n=1 Tax=Eurytemora carolleeae TaxID=1294199 RepID=UPI000C77842F|nr:transmembrane protein 39A isoform X2 [Eurytemora carolleeae]|eukprot:XP_023337791.1 transmembrane protein 39A-like isoform X2 [Eurytemora affinis]